MNGAVTCMNCKMSMKEEERDREINGLNRIGKMKIQS